MSKESTSSDISLCLVGCGNIGEALIQGLVKSDYKDIVLYNKSNDKAQKLSEELNLGFLNDFSQILDKKSSNKTLFIVLALKPNIILSFLKENRDIFLKLSGKVIFCSLAAGVMLEELKDSGPRNQDDLNFEYVRVMPNLAMAVNSGYSGIYSESEFAKSAARNIFSKVGLAQTFESEDLISVCTAIAGSGPAFVAEIINAMCLQGIKEGLSAEISRNMALSSAFAASKTLLESEEPLELFIKRVTTPGGTTEAGLRVLRESDVSKAFEGAVAAAASRARS